MRIFNALPIKPSYANKYKCYVIETDSELQSLAAYCWAKSALTEVSQSVSGTDNEFSSNILCNIPSLKILYFYFY